MAAEEQKPQASTAGKQKGKKQRRNRAFIIATSLFVLIGIAYFIYWYVDLRHHQETDDAYVAGNQIQIMSQIPGSVTQINVENTDLVNEGDVLVILDATDAQQSFEQAQNSLASSVRQTHQLIINNRQLQANIEVKQTALSQAKSDLSRREALAKASAIGREELQHSRDAVTSAEAELEVAVQQYKANQALVLNTPLEQQPAILQSASQLRDAWLTLQRTKILAPTTGYVSRRSVQVGTSISSGSPLMAVVPANQIWVDANFKETQLANMRIGQPAVIISDFYGDKVVYNGRVAGLDMGTGSAFSLLPAQNATGNWIKVVQRLAVRIELDPKQVADHPLRIGLSMRVTVNTENKQGLVLSDKASDTLAYKTNVLSYNMKPVDDLIATIISANAS